MEAYTSDGSSECRSNCVAFFGGSLESRGSRSLEHARVNSFFRGLFCAKEFPVEVGNTMARDFVTRAQ